MFKCILLTSIIRKDDYMKRLLVLALTTTVAAQVVAMAPSPLVNSILTQFLNNYNAGKLDTFGWIKTYDQLQTYPGVLESIKAFFMVHKDEIINHANQVADDIYATRQQKDNAQAGLQAIGLTLRTDLAAKEADALWKKLTGARSNFYQSGSAEEKFAALQE